jgi:hypothetical protein
LDGGGNIFIQIILWIIIRIWYVFFYSY